MVKEDILEVQLTSPSENSEESVPSRKAYPCSVCSKQYTSKVGLKYHMNVHNNVFFSCSICAKQCKSQPSLRYHMKVCGRRPDEIVPRGRKKKVDQNINERNGSAEPLGIVETYLNERVEQMIPPGYSNSDGNPGTSGGVPQCAN